MLFFVLGKCLASLVLWMPCSFACALICPSKTAKHVLRSWPQAACTALSATSQFTPPTKLSLFLLPAWHVTCLCNRCGIDWCLCPLPPRQRFDDGVSFSRVFVAPDRASISAARTSSINSAPTMHAFWKGPLHLYNPRWQPFPIRWWG